VQQVTPGEVALLTLVLLYLTDTLHKLGIAKPGWDVLLVFGLLGVYFTGNVLSHGRVDNGDVVMAVLYVNAAWVRFQVARNRALSAQALLTPARAVE
jgi:hypothetical protein